MTPPTTAHEWGRKKRKKGGKWPGYPDGSRERDTHTE
jgi:hypothetical protein